MVWKALHCEFWEAAASLASEATPKSHGAQISRLPNRSERNDASNSTVTLGGALRKAAAHRLRTPTLAAMGLRPDNVQLLMSGLSGSGRNCFVGC